MEYTAIIPDRCDWVSTQQDELDSQQPTNVVGVLPLEPHLEIVSVDDQVVEPLQEIIAFFLLEAIDVLGEHAHGEDGVPACDRIGSDDLMYMSILWSLHLDIVKGVSLHTGWLASRALPILSGDPLGFSYNWNFPVAAISWNPEPMCVAVRPSRNFWYGLLMRSYISYPDAHKVSPPVFGNCTSLNDV